MAQRGKHEGDREWGTTGKWKKKMEGQKETSVRCNKTMVQKKANCTKILKAFCPSGDFAQLGC